MIIVFKVLGAYLGFKIALLLHYSGFAGAAIGIIIGHALDAGLQARLARARAEWFWRNRAKQEFELRFINSLFLMFGKLCTVDSEITAAESDAVEKITSEVFTLSKKAKKKAFQTFRNSSSSSSSFQYDAAQFFDLYQEQPQLLENLIGILFNVAAADASINEAEEKLILSASHIFNISPERYKQIRNIYISGTKANDRSGTKSQSRSFGFTKDTEEFYKILGCKKSDPVSVIKQNYRKLVSDYHPDKIIAKNLPEDFVKFANDKFKSIQEAYEAIKADRGFN